MKKNMVGGTAANLMTLPDELILLILSGLPPHIILEFTQTHPRFRRFLDDGQLWQHLSPKWQVAIILNAMRFEKKNFIAAIYKELNKVSRDAQIEFLNIFIENTFAYGPELSQNNTIQLAIEFNSDKDKVEENLLAFLEKYAKLTPAMTIFHHKATFRERFCRAAEISKRYISDCDRQLAQRLLEIKDRQLTTDEFTILNNILNGLAELRLPYELNLNYQALNFNTLARVLETNTSIKHLHLHNGSEWLLRSYLLLNALIKNTTLSSITIGKIAATNIAHVLNVEADYVENFSKAIEYLLKNNPRITRLDLEDNLLDTNNLSCLNNLETFGYSNLATDSDSTIQPNDQLAYRLAQIPGKPIKMELDSTVVRRYKNRKFIYGCDTQPSRVKFLTLNSAIYMGEMYENNAYFSNLEHLELHGTRHYYTDSISILLRKPYKLQNLDYSHISSDFLGASSISISLSVPELINILNLLNKKRKLKIALSINTIDSEKKLLTLMALLNNDTLPQIYIRNGNIYLPLANYCNDYLHLISEPPESAASWREYTYCHFPERRNTGNIFSHAYNQNNIDWRRIYLDLTRLETIAPAEKVFLAPINHGEFALHINDANIDHDFLEHLQDLFNTINITKIIVSKSTFDFSSFIVFCQKVKNNHLIKSIELLKTKTNKNSLSATRNEMELDYTHFFTRSGFLHEIIIDNPINVAKNNICRTTKLAIPCSLRKLAFKNCCDLSNYIPKLSDLLQNLDSQLELLDLSNSVTALEASALTQALPENTRLKCLQFSETLDKNKILFALSKQTSAKVYLGEHSLATDLCAIIDWEIYTKKQYSEICQHLQTNSIANWQIFCGLITILEELKQRFQFSYELNTNNDYIELFLTRTNNEPLHGYIIKFIQPFLKDIRLKIGKINAKTIISLVTETPVFSQLDLTASDLDMQQAMTIVTKAAPKSDLMIILSDDLAKDRYASLAFSTAMSCPRVNVQFKFDAAVASTDHDCHSQEKRWGLFLQAFKSSKAVRALLPQLAIYRKDECENIAATNYYAISAQVHNGISKFFFSIEFDFSHINLSWQNVRHLINNIDSDASIVFSEAALGNDYNEKAKNTLYLINTAQNHYDYLNRITIAKNGQNESLAMITKNTDELKSLVQNAYQIDRNNFWYPMLQGINKAEQAIELASFLGNLYGNNSRYYNPMRIPDICQLSDTMITEIINICNKRQYETRVLVANKRIISVAQAISINKNKKTHLCDFESVFAKANLWEKLRLLAIESHYSYDRDDTILFLATDILVFHLGVPINSNLTTIDFTETEKFIIKNKIEQLKQQTKVERFRYYPEGFTATITAIKNNSDINSIAKAIQGLKDYAEICALYNEIKYASGDLYYLQATKRSLYAPFLNLLKQETIRRLLADIEANNNEIELPAYIYNQLAKILRTTNYSRKLSFYESPATEKKLLMSEADEMNGAIRICRIEGKLTAFDLDANGKPTRELGCLTPKNQQANPALSLQPRLGG